MEITLSFEEYRKFEQELKEAVYGYFRRFELIIFPGARSKQISRLICGFIVDKLDKDEGQKQSDYMALLDPVYRITRRQIHPGWLIQKKPFFIGTLYREIAGYLLSSGILKIYYPPET